MLFRYAWVLSTGNRFFLHPCCQMWPHLSKWVGWMQGHFLIVTYFPRQPRLFSSCFYYVDFGFSAKSDCPVFFCSTHVHFKKINEKFINVIKICFKNAPLLLGTRLWSLSADFSEWDAAVVATSIFFYNKTGKLILIIFAAFEKSWTVCSLLWCMYVYITKKYHCESFWRAGLQIWDRLVWQAATSTQRPDALWFNCVTATLSVSGTKTLQVLVKNVCGPYKGG